MKYICYQLFVSHFIISRKEICYVKYLTKANSPKANSPKANSLKANSPKAYLPKANALKANSPKANFA